MGKLAVMSVVMLFAASSLAHAQGKSDYDAYCAGCHGAADSHTEKAHPSKAVPGKPVLRESRKSREEMTKIIENGKGEMPAFRDELNRKRIAAIVLFIMTLRKSQAR